MMRRRPIIMWHKEGWREGMRVRVTGRNAGRKARVELLRDDGTAVNVHRYANPHELRVSNRMDFEDPVAELNRLLAEAPFIGKGNDPGPPALGGTKPDTDTGNLFGAAP